MTYLNSPLHRILEATGMLFKKSNGRNIRTIFSSGL